MSMMAMSLQAALQCLGAKRVEATLLASLLEKGPQGTRDIVDATRLRQPEVSVGMQLLRERGWVEAESVPREGKGRPMHRYSLTTDAAKIRKHYEAEGKQAAKDIQSAIDTLKKRLG